MIRGSKEYKSGNKSTLRGFGGDYIYSPIDGTIEHIDSSICNGLLIIKKKGLEDEYIEICGVKEPFVYQGQRVYLGDKLGTSKEKNLNVDITKKKKIKSYPDKKVKSYKSKSSYSPIITKNEFEKLPYTLQAMPMKLSLDLGKTILGIKEEINQIKKLLK
jgi:hypothetical protein